jgi:hypothetical protein
MHAELVEKRSEWCERCAHADEDCRSELYYSTECPQKHHHVVEHARRNSLISAIGQFSHKSAVKPGIHCGGIGAVALIGEFVRKLVKV